jgi:hypothetical protein
VTSQTLTPVETHRANSQQPFDSNNEIPTMRLACGVSTKIKMIAHQTVTALRLPKPMIQCQ